MQEKNKQIEKVAAITCKSYNQIEVDKAIEKALSLIDFRFKKNSKVLIKPNVVGCFPKKQIIATTNPSLVEAVCKILKKHNCKIYIGDSPFTNEAPSFKASGIDKVAKKYGKLLYLEQEKLVNIRDKNAKVLKNFPLPKIIKQVDLVINMPKMKTHSLTKYTGAIKNLYGCIPGGLKQRLHNQAHGDEKFSNLLVDIYQNIQPQLTIMDGIIAMEGEGPTSGDPKKANIILASKNGIALDLAATKLMGYKTKKILTTKEAIKRKLYAGYKFELVGLKQLPNLHFKTPSSVEISKTKQLLKSLFKEKPIICDTKKCIKCKMCANHCPVQAISMQPFPVIDKNKCIRCFCCIEICPTDAMHLEC